MPFETGQGVVSQRKSGREQKFKEFHSLTGRRNYSGIGWLLIITSVKKAIKDQVQESGQFPLLFR